MSFGDVTDEATSFDIMDSALDAGTNLSDTADVYGGPQTPDMAEGCGRSEQIIGRWLSAGTGMANTTPPSLPPSSDREPPNNSPQACAPWTCPTITTAPGHEPAHQPGKRA
jgi:hypothetical protein